MAQYGCYGLSVLTPRVEFVRGRASDFPPETARNPLHQNGHDRWFRYQRLQDGSDYVRWEGLFEFLIAGNGRRIIAHPLGPVAQEALHTYLYGQVLSFALLKLGLEPLHATTVVIDGMAVAFLGDCRAGKSTLAARCLQAGYRLLTDDLLVLRRRQGRFLAYPGPARIKLMPSIAARLLGRQAVGCRMNPFTAKLVIPLQPAQYARSPTPLAAIYVLSPPRWHAGAPMVIRRLSGQAAWQALTTGAFNTVVREPQRLAQQFAWATELAGAVPVKSLHYPRRLKPLDHVLHAIEEDLAGGLS